MAEDNTLKPPEGWISEGHSSTSEIREPSDSNGPEAPNSDWMYESRPEQRNPSTDAITGAVIGASSKLVNPLTEKAIHLAADKIAGPVVAGAKSSIYRPQPSTPVAKWTRAMHTGDISAAKDARHFGEVSEKMRQFYEAEKKLEALRKAEALFQTEEQIRKAATPVTNVIRTASEVMSPTGESLLGKVAGFGAQTLGRALAGGSAAYQGVDAYNRFKNDDYLGGTIGAIGALGSGAALIPTPITRVLGAGIGLGAEGANYLLDKYRASQQPGMAQGGLAHLAGGGQPSVQQIQSNISPQEQAIVDYHRNTIASGNIGRDDHNNPVTVYSSTVDIPSGLHAGKVTTVPGYYDNQIHNDPREIYARWAEQIDQGKWPIYYDPRTGDTRAKYIHGIMDQEKPK
jgi:hypothetical protein